MYYKFASPTARRFVELGFYSTYFGEEADAELYLRCRDAIAPTLTESDISYLLRFENEPGTKSYLNELLARLRAPAPQPGPVPAPRPAAQPETLPAPPPAEKPPRPAKRRNARKRYAHTPSVGDDEPHSALGLKVLATLAIVGLAIIIGAIQAYKNDARENEAARQRATVRDLPPPSPSAEQTMRPEKKIVSEPRSASPTTAGQSTEAPEDLPAQSLADNAPQPTNSTPVVAAVRKKARKVVFTDGTRIRTLSDGTIEVPRAFSYAGAGLKKPFWIYDKQLEKSGRIEYEARAEKTARNKWKALYDEASRACAKD